MARIKEMRRRDRSHRNRRPVVYLICEGKETEIRYFRRFRSRECLIEIVPKVSQHKEALSLVQHAKDVIKQEPYYPDEGDTVWCVFDRDDNTNDNLETAVRIAKQLGYRIAFSNPSFELWFLLHFRDQHAELRDADSIIAIFHNEGYLPHYEKNVDVYDAIAAQQNIAMRRAEQRREAVQASGLPLISRESNPATSVHLLVNYLIEKRG